MKNPAIKETHYGTEVLVNKEMDTLRKTECLCLNCENMKPGLPEHCGIAQQIYNICVAQNVAMAITRCPIFKPKTNG